MTQSTHTISPLRQRMIDDMTMRRISRNTQQTYIRAVKKLHPVPRAITRHRNRRGFPVVSIAPGRE